MRANVVREKSFAFAIRTIRLARLLRRCGEYELSRQLLRAGTSIGANVEEAQAGVSRADFVARIAVASKEARESHYWLRLLHREEILSRDVTLPALAEAEELIRLLTSIVKTAQSRR